MIRVLFFARLREQLDCRELELPAGAELETVAALRDALVRRKGSAWAEALMADNVIAAVNQEVAGPQTPVRDGDEVAFYPPVTGG